MGLRGDCSNTPDWKDVAMIVETLERSWDRPIRIHLFRIGSGKFASLRLQAELIEEIDPFGEVRPSVYTQCDMSSGEFGDMNAALLSLLYRLDFAASDQKNLRDSST